MCCYYVTNLQGDVVAILDSNGAVMVNYHTINTANKMNNQVNGIAFQNWGPFKTIAKGTLKYAENRMTNEILYWTEN